MKFERLGEIMKIAKGKKHEPAPKKEGRNFRYIQIDDLRNDNNLKYTNEKGTEVNENDLIIAWDGANAGTIGFGLRGMIGSTLARLRIKDEKEYSTDFIGYLLRSQNKFLRSKTTGATIPHISKNALESIKIPQLDFPEQHSAALVLKKSEALIEQRKQSIALLDEFLKSTFLEMFGNPLSNEKKWKLFNLSEFGESRLGKMLDGKKIIGNNLKPYLRNTNVLWFGFELDDLLEMDFDEKDKKEFSLERGEILMCEGGEIGRCAIWKNELQECYFQKAIHRIRLNKKFALPEYFVFMFWQYTINGGLKKFMNAATISHLTGEKLKKMKLPIPPIELQSQFANIVTKTEALKEQYKNSLQELENLYSSLSQKAFKGELEFAKEKFVTEK